MVKTCERTAQATSSHAAMMMPSDLRHSAQHRRDDDQDHQIWNRQKQSMRRRITASPKHLHSGVETSNVPTLTPMIRDNPDLQRGGRPEMRLARNLALLICTQKVLEIWRSGRSAGATSPVSRVTTSCPRRRTTARAEHHNTAPASYCSRWRATVARCHFTLPITFSNLNAGI